MLQIGTYQLLEINRLTSVGFFLEDPKSGEEVLLPHKYITSSMDVGDTIEVFVYKDSEDRIVATTETPHLALGEFAYLKAKEVNAMGAFMDWGLMEKNLLVPFKNQARRMEEGRYYVVYMYEDETTQRLVGTSKVDAFLEKEIQGRLREGEEVNILVRGHGDIGINVIVNHMFPGLIYLNEVFQDLKPGDQRIAYVKHIREDQKIDISLNPIGYASIEPNAQKIFDALKENDGFLPYTDKSSPASIREAFGMSKKLFKKAVGALYKQRLVELKKDGMYKTRV